MTGFDRMSATLDRPRFEDLVADLLLVGLTQGRSRPRRTGQAESTSLIADARRITDWYRRQYGDRRSHDPLLDPKSAMLVEPAGSCELLSPMTATNNRPRAYAEAVERLGHDRDLSRKRATRCTGSSCPAHGRIQDA